MIPRLTARSVAPAIAGLVLVVSILAVGAAPAAAVGPTISGPASFAVTTHATVTLSGAGAPRVADADSTTLEVRLEINGDPPEQPTFTLDGVAGLTVTGSATNSRSVTVAGPIASINAALDGMRLNGGAPSLDYALAVIADDSPGVTGGITSRAFLIQQRGTGPVNDMPPSFSVGLGQTKVLTGDAAPQTSDTTSPTGDIELDIGQQTGGTVPQAEWPSFSFPDTTGLTVTGSATNSRSVTLAGTFAALNAALDGMTVTGGPTAGAFRLVVETDDVVGPGGGNGALADVDFVNFSVTALAPVNGGIASVDMGTWSSRTMAPLTVSDADTAVLETTFSLVRIPPDATSVLPTFTLPTTAGTTVLAGSATNSTSVRLSGPIAALNAALAGIVLTATSDAGAFAYSLTTDDVVGPAVGRTDTDNATVTVTSEAPTAIVGNVSVGVLAQATLVGSRAPSVGDADDDAVEALLEVQRTGGDTTSVRPTFTLDGTSGLTITEGSATASTRVVVVGSPAAIDAALDGMTITGGPVTGTYALRLRVDEVVGSGSGQIATDTSELRVTALAPTATSPDDFTMSSSTTRTLSGADAPRVTDADSPTVDVEVRLVSLLGGAVGARFGLDGTVGLTVTSGSATSSTSVVVSGPLASVNAALDGMRVVASTSAELVALQVAVDDVPGTTVGRTATATTEITITAVAPVATAGEDLSVGTFAASPPLVGAEAPSVADADSPLVDVTVSTTSVGALPTSLHPTFSLDGTAGVTVVSGSATDTRSVTLQGSPAAIDAILDGMTVRGGSAADEFGIRVTVDDVPGVGGTASSATTSVTVTDEAPTLSVPATPIAVLVGGSRPAVVFVDDADSPQLEARVRVVGAASSRPTLQLDGAGLTFSSGAPGGSFDVTFHGPRSTMVVALSGLRVVGGTALGTFTVEVTIDDAVPEVGNSVTRTFSTVVQSLPSAPTSVAASARVSGAVVTWQPPATAGTATQTGFRVVALRGTTVVGSVTITGTTARSHTFTGLANASAHTFRVSVATALGEGPLAEATATPQAFLPFGSAGAMVDRLYLDLLGRAPTAGERSAAIAPLANGTGTAAALVAALRGSSDNLTNVDPVTRLYQAYFLRIPDQGGLDFWIARRRSGQGLNPISEGFARSPEFTTLYGSLTNQGFVELVYQNVLGRPGAASEVAFWTGQLDTGVRTRGRVMTGFSESPEYRAQQRNAVDVSVAFIALLGRRPTTPEHTLLVAALKNGTLTVAALHTSILEGAEYAGLVT